MDNNLITDICKHYGVNSELIGDVIDSSHGEADIRYNYVINNKLVLKICTSKVISEVYLQGIKRLVARYRDLGVYCPDLIVNRNNELLTSIEYDGQVYNCYIEEFAPYDFAQDDDMLYESKKEMLVHVGKLATKYSGMDLVPFNSMWSIIDLSPYDDQAVDEKQENLDLLIESLIKHGYLEEANMLSDRNNEARSNISIVLNKLPRCVYQGDLNPSNILVDNDRHFVGIIDFNMYGTEVNINCFLNECMYYLKEEDFEQLQVDEIINKMNSIQNELLQSILEYYELNELEKKVFKDYKRIIDISFYPNVMLWIKLLDENRHTDKVLVILRELGKAEESNIAKLRLYQKRRS